MVAHRKDGWELADYEWNPDTMIATLIYERVRVDTGEIQEKTITKEHRGDNWKF